jgi:hypothetical protein
MKQLFLLLSLLITTSYSVAAVITTTCTQTCPDSGGACTAQSCSTSGTAASNSGPPAPGAPSCTLSSNPANTSLTNAGGSITFTVSNCTGSAPTAYSWSVQSLTASCSANSPTCTVNFPNNTTTSPVQYSVFGTPNGGTSTPNAIPVTVAASNSQTATNCANMGVASINNLGFIRSGTYHVDGQGAQDITTFQVRLPSGAVGNLQTGEYASSQNLRTVVISAQPDCGPPITNGTSSSTNAGFYVMPSAYCASYSYPCMVDPNQTFYVTIYSRNGYPGNRWTCDGGAGTCNYIMQLNGF